MNDLADFLRARLAEDKALAREAPQGPWHIGNAVDPTQPCNVHTFPDVRLVADDLNWLVAEHIAHNNPARVLADVDAKRRVVDLHGADPHECVAWDRAIGERYTCYERDCPTLRLLALPYASHESYREEWKP